MVTPICNFRELQRQKRHSVNWVVAASAFLVVALTGRFVQRFNDALSGPPRYMEAFADLMGRQIASTTANQYPVLVSQADNADCRSVNQDSSPDYEDAYYVLTYSEQSRSVCLTVYGALSRGSRVPGTTLSAGSGRNFGRELTNPVRVVPLHRSLTVLAPEYLALLHWRTKVDPRANVRAGAAQRITSPSAQISFADASLDFTDIRAEVARQHDLVNRVLLVLVLASSGVLLLLLWRLTAIYTSSLRLCRSYSSELSLRAFLTRDLSVAGHEIESEYQRKRQESLADARLEHILQRETEDATRRLCGLLESTQDENERRRIRSALDARNLDDMQMMLEELQPHLTRKTPEERLHLLLEPLKEYAGEDEIQQVETEALSALQKQGFRPARETVIRFHDQFRARYKKLIEETEQSTQPHESAG